MKPKTQQHSVPRRDFIKKASIASLGISIVPRHVLGGVGFTAPSDKLMVAGIGVGGKGQSDIKSFADSGLAEIAFLCDVDDRRAATSRERFPKAKYYKDYREMLEKEADKIDAVSVSTPDHGHAVQAMAAMQLGKHVYVQKPLTHDIYEARALTEAADKYKVVTQMGNQGASNDGTRLMSEWYDAGLIGEVTEVYCWTDRPVWPQGIPWPETSSAIPAELDWDLWLNTAPYKEYVDGLVPFNWRGWWDYGTGALGDMGCHLVEVPVRVLNLKYPKNVQCSVGSVYVDEFKRGYFPDSCPPSSHVTMTFPKTDKTSGDITLHWMDGGIQPTRPEELGPNEVFGDGGNGVLIVGTKGKMMCGTYGRNAQLLPTSKTEETMVPQKYDRVPGEAEGHYKQWVEAALAGYGKKEVSSPFSVAGPLTETLLIANLAIRGFDIRKEREGGGYEYPGRYIEMLWDAENMRVTNFEEANQFVRRNYREGWKLS
ncbi:MULTISPECIES: Gfo/Idh/MocA family oxidoreductase [unclassified Leeuwenhoekiella]|uniref:Gfo/Idh/MocA family protein n=1 Tax=unclassified Leeuwenhoekiella TaxID=2615029 RepID=UPI000C5B3D8F|nr:MULTISPECIES: Gfo/Idh/MocA family oxidoreductase [unclassified Leeuwenhoekiella]MAW97042.1 oxidoreductase [Leeuwenhoekiella sp.]MBA80677.1 oxidoreductase [Leeuwenhoekiella sp.]|tara:strand:- start:4897 stop:6348 length:1452 start_codon:yes stop_codon:yes gene_type:complete